MKAFERLTMVCYTSHRDDCLEAEPSYAKGLATSGSIRSDLGRANTLLELGNVQKGLSRSIKAGASYAQTLAIFENIGDNVYRPNALVATGYSQEKKSKDVEAETFYNQALAMCDSTNNGKDCLACCLGLSQIRLRQSRYAEARALINMLQRFPNWSVTNTAREPQKGYCMKSLKRRDWAPNQCLHSKLRSTMYVAAQLT